MTRDWIANHNFGRPENHNSTRRSKNASLTANKQRR